MDPDDNIRGKQFERICKWYLEHDPFYASQLAHVWLWKDWPGRWYPKKEAGIDLVAQHRDGTLWAIQAKAYDQAYAVTKHDVDKFLSESNRKDDNTGRPLFAYRLLLVTTRKQLGSTARNTINAQAIPVGYRGRTELDAVEIDWPASPSDLRARRLPPKKPIGHWAYQGEAMNNVVNGFRQADRGKLIMACGTGKTLTALFIREKLAARRTLVLVPSLQLMKQTIGEWTRNKTVDFDFLPVCSDETVSKDDEDMPVSSTSDLGLPVTTAPEEIAAFLRRRSGPLVVFATYQSSPEIAKAYRLGRVPAFDLAIADEAHRCAAAHSSEFATILDNEKIKAHRRLFMTATPRIYSAHVLKAAKEAGYEFASMDDEERFGKVFHRLTFHQAIERNLLTDYQVAIIGVDKATYRAWAEKGWFITIDGKEVKDARSVAGQIGLAKAMREYDLHRVITFHRLVKGATAFKASFPDVIDWMPARQRPKGKLWTDHVDGTMSAWERQRRLQRLGDVGTGEHGVISNARCLTEGIDVPTLDGVAFIDPKRSDIDIAQAVGRAIRLADGKTLGTIVIPVFIDTDEPDPDVILKDSAFKAVWDVLLALRAHDEDLAQQLDDLRRMLGRLPRGRRGSLRLPPKIKVVDIPDVCGGEFASAFKVRIIEQTTASWEFWFGLLEGFVQQNDHARVPQSYVVDGYRLGMWVNTQRQLHARGILNGDRKRRLACLPGWTWDPYGDQWEEGFSQLLKYVELNGDARVPKSCVIGGYKLGSWIKQQRRAFSKGLLDPDRELRLKALPGWTWDAYADQWESRFRLLLDYVEHYGDAVVPTSYRSDDGYQLGKWVAVQRNFHSDRTLEADREVRLENLPGWSWSGRDAMWEQGFRHLLDYVRRYGDALVPVAYKTDDGYPLGQWVATQRFFRAKGTLDADRERRLGELSGWMWNGRDAIWEERFRRLLDYVESNGDALVPRRYKDADGDSLGVWVMRQRKSYAEGTLEPGRERRLADVPGWTWKVRSPT
ncbi:DEAD/DEAH box helicase [Mycobacterium simulans]|uniref:DEAD/DEAH box helicase n=1 Tax=Mycobacterium simulans TaxID=627089 RepID=UPI00163E2126|nr:DEAD/DEAH box helicase [Mycobacterium simulans]